MTHHVPEPRGARRHNQHGLARITSTPAAAEYNVQQFLGDPPATVPPVLGADLFTATSAHGGPVIDRRRPSG